MFLIPIPSSHRRSSSLVSSIVTSPEGIPDLLAGLHSRPRRVADRNHDWSRGGQGSEKPARGGGNGSEKLGPTGSLPYGNQHHVVPLREGLNIPLRRRYSWSTLVGPVGLATELSFRRAAREGRRLRDGVGPSKSSAWSAPQTLAREVLEPLPNPGDRTVSVLLADGTKIKRQRRGHNEPIMDLRLVLSQERTGGQLQVAAFDLEAEAVPIGTNSVPIGRPAAGRLATHCVTNLLPGFGP